MFSKKNITLIVVLLVLISGCAASQIAQQTDDPLVINKAAYLDARRWYNQAQTNFIQAQPNLPAIDVSKYNIMLDRVGNALNTWGIGLMMRESDVSENFLRYKEERDKLIDAGFELLINK